MTKIVVSGARAIGEAVGISWQQVAWHVTHKGLPAWRIDGKGPYLALPDDLRAWVVRMRDENLQ